MIPGLVDSHMHLIGHGERLLRLDLSNCTSYSEVLALVQKRVEEAPRALGLLEKDGMKITLQIRKMFTRVI